MSPRVAGSIVRIAVLALITTAFMASSAGADGPGVGTPAVVTVGDSAISGEAGRWARRSPVATAPRRPRRTSAAAC